MNNIEYYNLLSVISLVMFIILTAMAVIMWFKLDIRHYLAVLTGSEAKRSIDKIRKDAASGEIQADRRRRNKAVVSWNTSENLDGTAADISRKLASSSQSAQSYDPDKTTVLGQPDPYATMVLSRLDQPQQNVVAEPILKPEAEQTPAPSPAPSPTPGFVVEKDITNTAQ
ncbi:MAG: hypothetical protein K6C96_06650 [Butyrivibrio sp.]|nr:hypothetical protein [Butyrivibrio sp.]